MDARKEHILGAIIKEYTKTAEPVSSGLVFEKCNLGISPATIRMEMLELEKDGFLEQPHTSAGRVPTNKAFRYFVDNLLSQRENALTGSEKEYIKSEINSAGDDPHLISRQIAKSVAKISNNFTLGGIVNTGEFFKSGFSGLFEMPEFQEHERMIRVSSFFDQFERHIDKIFEEFFELDFRVLIGEENPIKDIYEETVIMARYPLPNDNDGAAFMVGPIRMRYDKNIALMRYISNLMNSQF